MKWVVGGSFIAVGLWLLLPDKDEDPDGKVAEIRRIYGDGCPVFLG